MGNVRGKESSDWLILSGAHFGDFKGWRVCGLGGVDGGSGALLGLLLILQRQLFSESMNRSIGSPYENWRQKDLAEWFGLFIFRINFSLEESNVTEKI